MARSAPIVLPTEPATPDANALPDQPVPRPLAGPIVPLVASSVGTDQLLGVRARSVTVDAQQRGSWSKVSLCRHQPVAPTILPGRGAKSSTRAKGETPVASVSIDGNAQAQASPKAKKASPLKQDCQSFLCRFREMAGCLF